MWTMKCLRDSLASCPIGLMFDSKLGGVVRDPHLFLDRSQHDVGRDCSLAPSRCKGEQRMKWILSHYVQKHYLCFGQANLLKETRCKQFWQWTTSLVSLCWFYYDPACAEDVHLDHSLCIHLHPEPHPNHIRQLLHMTDRKLVSLTGSSLIILVIDNTIIIVISIIITPAQFF